jgi:hypothetical protein
MLTSATPTASGGCNLEWMRDYTLIWSCKGRNIVTGIEPNRSTTQVELTEGTIPLTTEMDGLVLSIESPVTLLFRTSLLLRQYRPRGKVPHGRPAPDPGLDIRHVKDKFHKVEETPWLAERLCRLTAERRAISNIDKSTNFDWLLFTKEKNGRRRTWCRCEHFCSHL